jgi:Mn2+/Fe2+ NRAMP family transporter
MLWTALITFPLMCAVQMMCARVGMVSGTGLAAALRKKFPVWVLGAMAGALFLANAINIGADLDGMAEVTQLLTRLDARIGVVLYGAAILFGTIYLRYARLAAIFKWCAAVLLAYVVAGFLVKPDWGRILHDTFVPSWPSGHAQWSTLVAILGTTISPYLFFWQSAQEVEEVDQDGAENPLTESPEQAPAAFARIRIDTIAGMLMSNVIGLAIMISTAATLHLAGKTDIQTAAEAALALKPIAGDFAFLLFSIGIIGTGLLAIPVLAGSAAYAIGEARGWRASLDTMPWEAKGFYTVIFAAIALGLGIDYSPIDPIKALYWSAVLNGVIAVPMMAAMMVVASHGKSMGDFTAGPVLKILGWITTAVMAAAAITMIYVVLV